MGSFRKFVESLNESSKIQEGNLWERHKELPSIFKSTYYSLPTNEQIKEFEKYQNLSSDDIVQGFGYTIVGKGVNSPQNTQKIIESISMLVNAYPNNKIYKEALTKAKKGN